MPTIRSALRWVLSRRIWRMRTPRTLISSSSLRCPISSPELVTGKLDGAFIETMVAESYATQYPELCLVLDGPL